MRPIRLLTTAVAALLCARALRVRADYPPYTSVVPPSDQFRITEPLIAAQPTATASPSPAQAFAQNAGLPPEVPWGQTARPANAPPFVAQSPPQYTAPDSTANSTIISPAPAVAHCNELVETTLYNRVDYFGWRETINGANFVSEDGVLITLGYVHRFGPQRIRAELFGSEVNYGAPISFGNSDPNDFLSAHTDYLGVRGEYEVIYQSEEHPNSDLFVGIGTRFWLRDFPDSVTQQNVPVTGYQENWWTIYPYLGTDVKYVLKSGRELYGMYRVGATVITWEKASILRNALFPRPGLTGQLEGGIRGQHWSLGAFAEAMHWGASHEEDHAIQPNSTMVTVGLKTGYNF